jgi:hypothetical protein
MWSVCTHLPIAMESIRLFVILISMQTMDTTNLAVFLLSVYKEVS